MRFACRITKATDTQLEYVIHKFDAVLRKTWLHESASVLPYTYTACLVILPTNTSTAEALSFFPSDILNFK